MLKRKIIAESIKSFLAENLLMEGWQMPSYELNEIGLVRFECMFDEDDYSEWLSDNELTDSQDVRLEYYKTEVTYDFELFDSVYFHSFIPSCLQGQSCSHEITLMKAGRGLSKKYATGGLLQRAADGFRYTILLVRH